jgi:hypothetical protein
MKHTPERCTSPNVFLSNLPTEMRRGDLRRIINRVGVETAFVEIASKKHGQPMPAAVAFVRLLHGFDVLDAIKKLNGVRIDARHIIRASRYISHLERERKSPQTTTYRSTVCATWARHQAGESAEATK